MKTYNVTGIYKNKKIVKAIIDSKHPDRVTVELWSKKPNYDQIPMGTSHYDIINLGYTNRKDYISMLFNKRDGATARKYLKKLNIKIIRKK